VTYDFLLAGGMAIAIGISEMKKLLNPMSSQTASH
jgi:hypothetical protein